MQLTKALPKLVKKASADELKEALEEHLRQTQQHVERLEQVFEMLALPVRGKKCEGMRSLISEGNEMIAEAEEDARDAVIIAGAQKVEHYEIATYGTLRNWANLIGKNDVADLLESTLEEEKDADQKLTSIAESVVNEAAAGHREEGDQEEEEEDGSRADGGSSGSRAGSRHEAADRGRSTGRRR
jgi:ferritin-like metal-binding protein YciE